MIVDLASFGGSTYATGFFSNICGASAAHIARWDGATWYAVGAGLDDAGHTMSVIDGSLYVAQYEQVVDSNWVRKWDGAAFIKVGQGVYLTTATTGGSQVPNIYDVQKYRGHLVACGEFDRVGNRAISGIMQWNGTSWDSVGTGLSGDMGGSGVMYPHHMLVVDTSLYIVGNFTTAGGMTVNGVARWDGTAWHAMGAGFNSTVYGIGMVNGELYAGGDFSASGATPLKCIAKWNGTAWVDPGFGVTATGPGSYAFVHTISQVGTKGVFEGGFDHVFVGASSHLANNIFANTLSGIDTMDGGVARANFEGLLVVDTATILVGGAVWPATGGQDTSRLMQYRFHTTTDVPTMSGRATGKVYPNPCTDHLCVNSERAGYRCIAMNALGQKMLETTTDTDTIDIDVSGLAPGMYLLRSIYPDGSIEHRKFTKQ